MYDVKATRTLRIRVTSRVSISVSMRGRGTVQLRFTTVEFERLPW